MLKSLTVGMVAIGLAFAPAAHADGSPGAAIIRTADRGHVMADGTVRAPEHPMQGEPMPGVQSKMPTVIESDGNPATMPTVRGEGGVICSNGQNFHSDMIPCG